MGDGWADKSKTMNSRYETSPREFERMNTAEMRADFLVQYLFLQNECTLTYSHYDRMVLGGIMPVNQAIELPNPDGLKSQYFLERRELGIINIGSGTGQITADGITYELDKLGCLYLGKGTQEVSFSSKEATTPAKFFLMSAPAHQSYPNTKYTKEQASPVTLGDASTSNCRTIYKYIHNDGIMSCQLVMGLTVLQSGSVWNTMPPHTHDRRSEVYCYFDIPASQGVMHFMGKPDETRHLWVQNEEAIISPPWSIHSGSGTANYSFIWAMAGENKDFTDMDHVNLNLMR